MTVDTLGFEFREVSNSMVTILHKEKRAAVLRKNKVVWFLEDMDGLDFASQQQAMAKLTDNYRRRNERTTKRHPRNSWTAPIIRLTTQSNDFLVPLAPMPVSWPVMKDNQTVVDRKK